MPGGEIIFDEGKEETFPKQTVRILSQKSKCRHVNRHQLNLMTSQYILGIVEHDLSVA